MSGYHTITKEDVGKSFIRLSNRMIPVSNFMGRILAIDVGKRIYLSNPPQVENDAQLKERITTMPQYPKPLPFICERCDKEALYLTKVSVRRPDLGPKKSSMLLVCPNCLQTLAAQTQ